MKLYFKYLKLNLLIWINYFTDFIFLSISSLLSLLFSLIMVLILFDNTNQIGGWMKYEVTFLLGYVFLIRAFFNTFFINIIGLSDWIKKGKLDIFLVRPRSVYLQVLAHGRYNTEFPIDELIASVIILSFSLKNLDININIVLFLVYVIISTVLLVSINTIISSLSFFIIKFDKAFEIKENVDMMTEYPISIYPNGFKLIFYILIPLAYVSYLPVKLLLNFNITNYEIILYILAIFLIPILAILLWNKGIKSYNSTNA